MLTKTNYKLPLFILALLILFNIRQTAFGALNHVYIDWHEFFTILSYQTFIFIAIACVFKLLLKTWTRASHGLCYLVFLWVFGKIIINAFFYYDLIVMLATIYLVITCFFIIFYLNKKYSHTLRLVVTVFALVLLSMQIPGLAKISSINKNEPIYTDLEKNLEGVNAENLPHVIYVIPDRYANNTILKRLYGFDNASFSKELKTRNFYVWDNQYSNYPKTFLSIASTMNTNYVNEYIETFPENSRSQLPIYDLINNNQAQRLFRKKGYRFTNICSNWGPTSINTNADINFFGKGFDLTETKRKYLETTPLNFFMFLTFDVNTCVTEDRKIELIHNVLNDDSPQFVFWHSLITHDPYIYNSDGTCRKDNEERFFMLDWAARQKNYIEHVEHFNKRVLKLFDTAQNISDRPVIFVIQADEGPFPYNYLNENILGKYNFSTADKDEMHRKHAIINAIYFPTQNYKNFEVQKTPINNLRLIFSEIYNQQLPLLDHKVYTFMHDDDPYKLEDITAKVLDE